MPEGNQPNSPPPDERAAIEAFGLRALRYLDGLVTEEEAQLLNKELAARAEFRELFAAISVEAGVLNEELLTTGGAGEVSDSVSAWTQSNMLVKFGQLRAAPRKGGWRSSRRGHWVLAASLFVSAVAIWMLRGNAPDQPQANVTPNTTPPSEIYSSHLVSGTTRITLPKVGYVIVEGPAEFNLLSPMRARLNSGRIKMRVTEESGHGFVVETPYGEVTDLGTEFGIDMSEKGKAGLVVFEGKVDLRVAEQEKPTATFSRVERLVGGDGVTFDRIGQLDRIMSIVTGENSTFQRENENHPENEGALITGIRDNLRTSDTKRFYEVVRAGFGEDARAHVDRNYEWNGLNEVGLPAYLVGADYILPFNDDKRLPLSITLSLARPATVYILFDDRGTRPTWLADKFVHTGDYVGMDEDGGPPSHVRKESQLGRGPAKSVDYVFSVWKQDVAVTGEIELGSREGPKGARSMYGVVVVPLKTAPAPKIGT